MATTKFAAITSFQSQDPLDTTVERLPSEQSNKTIMDDDIDHSDLRWVFGLDRKLKNYQLNSVFC